MSVTIARVTVDARLREMSFWEAEGRSNAWLSNRQVPAPDDDRLDHRGPIPGRGVSPRGRHPDGRVCAGVDDERVYDHVVVTHRYAQTFVFTT
ncbi:hypothetical protein [Rhodococcus opacus]|uniref:hypothetical protein n=1 Tax=Rhodococcus opacus TaxID=37919 RepID=UPI0012FE60FF|nr:hypothetical protein [Rhodococcus opacus]